MFGAILKATNSSFKKGMTFGRSIYVKKVMKLLAFIFEQPSYKSTAVAIIHLSHKERITFTTTRIHILPPTKAHGKLTIYYRVYRHSLKTRYCYRVYLLHCDVS